MSARALTDAQERKLAEAYLAGDGQTILARRFGVGQGTVRAALRRQGVTQRSSDVTNAPKADPAEMLRLHLEEHLNAKRIATRLGVSSSTVEKYLHRQGVGKLSNAKYCFDRAFFDVVDPVRAYWAGFIAADGSFHRNTMGIGIAKRDREVLEHLREAVPLEQPILGYTRASDGRHYVYLRVTSPEWVAALKANYRLQGGRGGKARRLRVPELGEVEAWAFVRGYFDGDGHAKHDGSSIQFTSGTKSFLRWIVRDVIGAEHAIYPHNGSWGCRITGETCRRTVPLLYAGSTPETRLDRKYQRLRRWLT